MRSNQYSLSIIVPVYNIKSYLHRCLNSILNQKVSYPVETIIIDDGSTDGSENICDSFAERNDNLKVIHKDNGGLSSARNTGIEHAHGKYIMFLDGDDWIEDNSLEKLVELTQFKTDMILIKAWHVNDSGRKKPKYKYSTPAGKYDITFFLKEIAKKTSEFSCCAQLYIYKTSFIKENHLLFMDNILHEDELWTPLALLKAKDIYVSDLLAYNHFVREGSIMHSQRLLKKRKESLEIICPVLFGEYRNYPSQETKHLKDRCVNLYLQTVTMDRDRHTNASSLKQRIAILSNAHRIKTILKALLFCISSRLYCALHDIFANHK